VSAPPRERAARRTLIAVLRQRGRSLTAEPLFEAGRSVTVRRDRHAGPGDMVAVRTSGQGRGQGRVERVLGRPDVARDVIEALMLDRGLERGFAPAVEREAAAARAPGQGRRDLRELATLTIDPASARDFDDAVSAQELAPDRWRVWVHIADVSAHVPLGSLVDREAARRATSVYLPGAVEPMLPHALSSQACSLVPDRDRAVVTAEMELDGAQVRRVAFYPATIRSDQRLDYDRVDRIFAGSEPALEPWGATLAAARACAAALAARRAQRGALAVESSEPEFAFDGDGQLTAMRPVPQTESHRLIEHLMIAANEQVARLLSQRRVPALYRVHERPEPLAVRRLADQLASLDVASVPLPDRMSPQQAADAVGEMSRLVADHVQRAGHGQRALTSLVLRSLKQAHYSPDNGGHAGLQSDNYCHFTSPIRRYPDLVCHRALLASVAGGLDAPRAAGMVAAGEWASMREREAVALERDADDVARCFLLERELGSADTAPAFAGEVVGLAPVGAFVAFGDGYEGLVPVRRMSGDWWELNELGTILHGTRTGQTIRLGDPIDVRVERVQAPRGRVDLLPVV
jgi:ribonuclease R